MKRAIPTWLAGLLGGALCLSTAGAAPKKIVFISHLASHGAGQHEYAAGCQLIGKWLEAAYGDAVVWEHHLIWPEDPDKAFDGAATVVFFCSGGGGHLVNNHVKEFDAVMRKGVGLACLHYAVEVPIGPSGKGMLNWMGGYFETDWSVNPHWVPRFTTFPEHPVANGLEPFEINDEWYFHMRFVSDSDPGLAPILSAPAPESTLNRDDGPHSGNPHVRKAVASGIPQQVAWVYQRGEDYGKGRGFGFTGLHYHKNLENDYFRKTVLNGVAWTAGLEVPENGIESPRPSPELLEQSIIDAQALKEQDANEKKTRPLTDKPVGTPEP